MTIPPDLMGLVEFAKAAASYFRSRGDGGEDRAFWANSANAHNCEKLAVVLVEQQERIVQLTREERIWIDAHRKTIALLTEAISVLEPFVGDKFYDRDISAARSFIARVKASPEAEAT